MSVCGHRQASPYGLWLDVVDLTSWGGDVASRTRVERGTKLLKKTKEKNSQATALVTGHVTPAGTNEVIALCLQYGPRLTKSTDNRDSIFFFYFHEKCTKNSALLLIEERRSAF